MKLTLALFFLTGPTAICFGSELDQAARLFSGPVEVVSEDPRFNWLESPVWSESGQYLLFSDVKWRREEDGIICGMLWKYDDTTKDVTELLTCSGIVGPPGPDAVDGLPSDMAELAEGGSNGLSWGWDDGILLMNQHGWKRTVSFLVDDIDESTSSIDPDLVTVVNESFDGAPFNSPNDMIVAGDGNLYFTDPPYGLQYSTVDDPFGNSFELMTQDKPAVYRRTEEGDLERLLEYEVDSDWAKRSGPNGVARIDANGDLAVAITDFGNPRTEIYSSDDDGTFNPIPSATLLHEYRIEGEFDFFPALVDGITYDADIGVLFISGPGGIYIYDAAVGKSYDLLGFIRIDDLCSNNVVGGGYLWMTCNQRVLRIPLAVMDGVEAEDDDSSSGFHLALQQFFPVWLIGAVAFSLI